LLLSEPPLFNPHFWFILSDPDERGMVVAVMLRSVKRYTDPTLVLHAGDHPFVRHDSSVHYSTARQIGLGALRRALEGGQAHLRDDCSPALLERIRGGLIESPFTVHAIREYCLKRW
jgi:hypothetical protein